MLSVMISLGCVFAYLTFFFFFFPKKIFEIWAFAELILDCWETLGI